VARFSINEKSTPRYKTDPCYYHEHRLKGDTCRKTRTSKWPLSLSTIGTKPYKTNHTANNTQIYLVLPHVPNQKLAESLILTKSQNGRQPKLVGASGRSSSSCDRRVPDYPGISHEL
jgi:hypothetical protein